MNKKFIESDDDEAGYYSMTGAASMGLRRRAAVQTIRHGMGTWE